MSVKKGFEKVERLLFSVLIWRAPKKTSEDCSVECAGGADNICSGHGRCLDDGRCACEPLEITNEDTRVCDFVATVHLTVRFLC